MIKRKIAVSVSVRAKAIRETTFCLNKDWSLSVKNRCTSGIVESANNNWFSDHVGCIIFFRFVGLSQFMCSFSCTLPRFIWPERSKIIALSGKSSILLPVFGFCCSSHSRKLVIFLIVSAKDSFKFLPCFVTGCTHSTFSRKILISVQKKKITKDKSTERKSWVF